MRRALLGLASLLCALSLVGFFALLGAAVAEGSRADGGITSLALSEGLYFGIVSGLTLFTVAVVGFFIHDCFTNPRVRADQRVLWLIVLLAGHALAMPIYWWIHVRPAQGQPVS